MSGAVADETEGMLFSKTRMHDCYEFSFQREDYSLTIFHLN